MPDGLALQIRRRPALLPLLMTASVSDQVRLFDVVRRTRLPIEPASPRRADTSFEVRERVADGEHRLSEDEGASIAAAIGLTFPGPICNTAMS